jgi:TetR/AcrR family transcriptional regulator, cholesterol catabolism regulator
MEASPLRQPRRAIPRRKQEPAVAPLHRTRKRRDREVVDAAALIFYERGYADASVQDVADALGILKGSLYHYIETKEDLLFRILEELHNDVQEILEEVAAVEGLSPLQRLALYVRRQVEFNVENLPRVAVYYNDVERLSEERRLQILARRKMHERFVSDLIREAQKRGDASPDLDAKLLSNFIHGAVIWTYQWARPGGRVRREKIANSCAEFVLNGVVGRAA